MSTTDAATRPPGAARFKSASLAGRRGSCSGCWSACSCFALPLLNIPVITTTDSDFGGVLFTVADLRPGGARPQHRRRLRRPARPGLRRLLRRRRLHRRPSSAPSTATCRGCVAVPIAIVVAMVSGVILGAPDAARARRLPRHRDARASARSSGSPSINSDWLGGDAGISDIPRPPSIEIVGRSRTSTGAAGPPVVDLDTTDHLPEVRRQRRRSLTTGWRYVVIIVLVFADILIKDSRVGRAWEATREDEDAAELMGVPTFRFKLLAFAIGASIGGLVGCAVRRQAGLHQPGSFLLLLSILFVAAVVVGGAGNRWGVIVGARRGRLLPRAVPRVPRTGGCWSSAWR